MSVSPILTSGAALGEASVAVVLVHGRGATGADILGLGAEIARGLPGVALVAPQAVPGAPGAWYPHSFLATHAANEPHLSAALAAVVAAVHAARAGGAARIVLGGFSQGACLALEVAARHGAALGLSAAFGLSGGLIGTSTGPDGAARFDYDAHLGGLPVFAGVAPDDPHIPLSRFRASAAVFERVGAAADFRVYPGLGHAVSADEVAAVRALVAGD